MKQVDNHTFFEQAEALLAEGQEVRIRMRGNSMRPLLRNGRDSVVLTPRSRVAELRRGDVVLFRCAGRHLLHRIRTVRDGRYTLAGDGNGRTTERCSTEDIAAVATAVVRPSGRIVRTDCLRWRLASRAWLLLPVFIRRLLLSICGRTGIR